MGINSEEDGGFAVPDLFTDRLFTVDPLEAYVRSRALVLPPGKTDGKAELPAFRQGAGGTLTVMTFSAVQEGTAGTSNSPKLDTITLEPQRTSAYATLGNSLLRNQKQLSTWLETAFRKAKAAVEENYFLQGTGGLQPVGLLNSACRLNVTRNAPNSIVSADVVNMAKAQHNLAGAIWIVSQSALQQVELLRSPDGMLLHLPMFYTNRLPTLGTAGDLILVDCSKYVVLDGVDISVRASPHVGWTQDTTLLKFTWWLDAACGVKAALTMEDGTVVSPVVVLN